MTPKEKKERKEQLEKLFSQMFKEASAAALEARRTPDDGTCCLDVPTLRVKGCPSTWVETAARRHGFLPMRRGRGLGWFLYGRLDGQAGRRTAMTEAAAHVMRGYEERCKALDVELFASIYYQMD